MSPISESFDALPFPMLTARSDELESHMSDLEAEVDDEPLAIPKS